MDLEEFVLNEVAPYLERMSSYNAGLRKKLLPYIEFIVDTSLESKIVYDKPLQPEGIRILFPNNIKENEINNASKIYDETLAIAGKAAEHICNSKAPALGYVAIYKLITLCFGKSEDEFKIELSQNPVLLELSEFEQEFGSMGNVPGFEELVKKAKKEKE